MPPVLHRRRRRAAEDGAEVPVRAQLPNKQHLSEIKPVMLENRTDRHLEPAIERP